MKMKIAVAAQNGQIFQHFGKCPQFVIYTTEDGVITGSSTVDATGSGHSALAGFLKAQGADVVICGGIGEGARNMLAAQGISLVYGMQGEIQQAAERYLAGELFSNDAGLCGHHHGEGHSCQCGHGK